MNEFNLKEKKTCFLNVLGTKLLDDLFTDFKHSLCINMLHDVYLFVFLELISLLHEKESESVKG